MHLGPGPFRPRLLPVVVAALVAPPIPGVAGASDAAAKEKARRWYEEGVALFREGRYAEAAERFQLAYNVDPAPNLLYNLARAHEEAGDRETAALFFQSYLDRYPEADDRAEVEQRIASLRAATPPAAEAKPAPEPPPAEAPPPSEPPPSEARPTAEPPPEAKPAADPPVSEAGTAVAPADDPSRFALSVWLAAGTGGEAEYEGAETRPRVGPSMELGSLDEELERSGGLGAALEYRPIAMLAVGARLLLASHEGEKTEFESTAVNVGPLVRGLLPLGADWRVHAAAWGGLTMFRATADDADGAATDFEGTGWHLGAGAGGAYAVLPTLWITATLGATRETFALESEPARFPVANGVLATDTVFRIDETVVTRWHLELGVSFDL